MDAVALQRHSIKSLSRLMPRLEVRYADQIDQGAWQSYVQRIKTHFPRLFGLLYQLYGHQYDFFYHLEQILDSTTQMWIKRPDELKALDVMREADPHWYQSHRMVGAMCYVDLFAGDLSGIRDRIPYLTELGITYLHLMPLFKTLEGDNDGGYAVSSYREVDLSLGTMEELANLATELRQHGISLVLDFVFNHTSDEHQWAKQAMAGDREHQEYYRMYCDRELPDEFEQTVNSVFPDEHPGCFTYRTKIRKWIWTTFCNYQWDLNYENPTVFSHMVEEMLFLANVGVEVLRLDAVAFLWKRLGSTCENLPEAHLLIQAFNAVLQIAAPAMVFKSEAIVHPDEVGRYIGEEECPLSYNPQLMALLWEALATRNTQVLRHAMQKRFDLPEGCAWVNYIRCHDDIGWTFSDNDAWELNINPLHHRQFLTAFYTNRFENSFARGLPFQENPDTQLARISGTTASLCGLEKGLYEQDSAQVELAIRRILLLHGILLTIGGIPLLYLGDELGILNDYDYGQSPEKDGDSRWAHRLAFDWARADSRRNSEEVWGQIYLGLLRLINIRQQNRAFTGSETVLMDPGNDHVFGYFRHHDDQSVLVLGNFTENEQAIVGRRLRLLGMRKTFTDIVSGTTITATQKLMLDPYQFMILIGVR
ncbi:cyclomaltodextrinase C-terminal domain-containing protein [Acaryochloris marina S15]|nr:cyclomaltodextrinase C-terminal domain-containing protein [Acaryochloris marina S15]